MRSGVDGGGNGGGGGGECAYKRFMWTEGGLRLTGGVVEVVVVVRV